MFESEDEFSQSNLTNDIKRFERFLEGESIGFLDTDRWEALIEHWMMQGDFNRAIITTEEALSQYGQNLLFKLRLAQAYMANGQLKDSLTVIDELENTSPPSCELLLTKASVFSQLKKHQLAIRSFHGAAALAEKEDLCEIYWDLSNEYQQINDFPQAIKMLEEAKELEPFNEGILYELAFCYEKIGNKKKCVEMYEKFLDENPYSYSAWYNLGNAFFQQDDYKKSAWAYDYCVVINPEFAPAHFNLGNAYLGMEDFEKAIEHYNEYIRLNGADATSLCYLGECYEHLGTLDLAKSCYQQSLEVDPKLPDAWLGLGILEDLNGNTKNAIILIQKALELSPKNGGIHHVLAGAYEKIEAYQLAQESYESSLELDPTDEECLKNYTEFISNLHGNKNALLYLDKFQSNYSNKIAKLLEVNLLWKTEQKTEAIEKFSKYAKENGTYSQKLFEINPALKNIEEFVHLTN